jgi:hypothetical protein
MRMGAGVLAGVLLGAILMGCATPLNSVQKAELMGYRAKGLEIKEKNPTTGAVLGILPGFGSFYAREPAFGVINLLLWPISILWDPISGYQGSEAINYSATKATLDKKMHKELKDLDDELASGAIQKDDFFKKKKEIEHKYSPDLE